MAGFVQKLGLGLAAGICLGAIAACQSTPEAPSSNQEEAPAESTTPAESEPQSLESNASESAPEDTTASTPTTTPGESVAPTPKPVPPLPAECNNPQTQAAMNTCAQAEYEQADVALNNAYQAVKAAVGPQKAEQLVTAEQAWLDFRDAYCEFVQAQYAGGSIQPMVYSGCLTQLTRDRTAELEQTKGTASSYEAADQALNSVYQDLQSYLSAADQELLTDAQLAWLDYRDAHCAFEAGDTNACLAQVTETRTQQLQQQLDTRSL